MTIRRITIALVSVMASISANAETAPRVEIPAAIQVQVEKLKCNICHDWTKKVFGPSWQDVADHYRGRTTYEYRGVAGDSPGEKLPLVQGLVKKVSTGGRGEWNKYLPMIANDPGGIHVNEITNIVKFIVSIPPGKLTGPPGK